MNEELQRLIDFIKSKEGLPADEKSNLIESLKSIDKELAVTAFKLERTEKVKRTTSILLEETIEELEQKRKAVEKQAHEAKIEASLERVRLQAMAMNTSDDLSSAVATVFEGLDEVGFKTIRCGIGIFNDQSKKVNVWTISPDKNDMTVSLSGDEVLEGHPLLEGIFDSWRDQTDYSYVLSGNDLIKYYDLVGDSNLPVKPPMDMNEEMIQYYYCVMFPAGGLYAFSESELGNEAKNLMKRFGDVFHLAFTRHLDLKRAEAQAREAQIEAALEKIRNRTLLMKDSSELNEAVAVFFQQFKELKLLPDNVRTYFSHVETLNDTVEVWMTRSDGSVMNRSHITPMNKSPELKEFYQRWKLEREVVNVAIYKGSSLKNYMNFLSTLPHVAEDKDYIKLFKSPPDQIVMTDAGFQQGFLGIMSFVELEKESIEMLRRFAKVFEFTYTRFLDLKKAEAQAREAQIEAALERVRARTMAMHHSNELAQTAAHLFSQLSELGIKPYRCNIAIVDNESESCCQLWSTTTSGNVIPTSSYMPLDEYNILTEMHNNWREQKSYHTIVLDHDKLKSWNEYILKFTQFKESGFQDQEEEPITNEPVILSNFNFKQGFFIIQMNDELDENELKIIHRFSKVFEQTYTRYLDLEKAEKQNKLIQAENERKSQELEEARQLQLAMLPKDIPQLPNLEIGVYMKTATEVGGDYYDFHLSENGTLTIVIGDATGHGMKAGTMVTITKSLFNTLASGKDILRTFNRISGVIKDMKFRQLSMCLQMVKIEENIFSISSAAMPPVFFFKKERNCVEEILLSGMPLGAMMNYKYRTEERKIQKGDVILMLSDGLPELSNQNGEYYGYDRIKKELKSVADSTPQEIIDHLGLSAEKWLNGNDADDDITFVVMKAK